MLRSRWLLPVLIFSLCVTTHAEPPAPKQTLATSEELNLLIKLHMEKLDKALATEATFEEQKQKTVRQSFGLLACVGQYLADQKMTNVNGPALRDAALLYGRNAPYADAQKALAELKEVVTGNVTGEHASEHPWNKLIRMGAMMEEINGQNSALVRTMKRSRGTPEEVLPGVTWSILALAMKADTHEVKDPAQMPQWNQWSDEFYQSSVKLAEALRKKDKEGIRAAFDAANKSCDTCHEVFQH